MTTVIVAAPNTASLDDLTIASLSKPDSPLYPFLRSRIEPMIAKTPLALKTLIATNPTFSFEPEWVFFFAFLKYYTPYSDNYATLDNNHKQMILQLWELYRQHFEI